VILPTSSPHLDQENSLERISSECFGQHCNEPSQHSPNIVKQLYRCFGTSQSLNCLATLSNFLTKQILRSPDALLTSSRQLSFLPQLYLCAVVTPSHLDTVDCDTLECNGMNFMTGMCIKLFYPIAIIFCVCYNLPYTIYGLNIRIVKKFLMLCQHVCKI